MLDRKIKYYYVFRHHPKKRTTVMLQIMLDCGYDALMPQKIPPLSPTNLHLGLRSMTYHKIPKVSTPSKAASHKTQYYSAREDDLRPNVTNESNTQSEFYERYEIN